MVKKHYLPRALDKRVRWLNNFAGRFDANGAALGFTEEEIQAVKNDAAMLSYASKVHNMMKGTHKSFTAFKDMLNEGTARKQQLSVPALPQLPPVPVPVAPGIFRRIGKLVQRIKARQGYTTVIGVSMGIIGPDQKVNFSKVRPHLKIRMAGGNFIIYWKKNVFSGIVLFINRNDGKGFMEEKGFLQPPSKLKITLPPGRQSALWQLKARYRLKDDVVGQFSPIVEVAVSN